MYPELTGRDTLTYFANLRGGVDWDHVAELAERLDADLSRKVGDLSSGNRQKVGLVQAFMNRPEMQELIEAATDGHALLDMITHEADLEEIFLTYYREGEEVRG